MNYSITRAFALPFQDVLEKTIDGLKKAGFGLLQQTNLSDKIHTVLGKNIERYELLMVCHPQFAYDIIHDDLDLGVFLPCTVVVYQKEDQVIVSALQAKILHETIIYDDTKNDVLERVGNILENILYTIA